METTTKPPMSKVTLKLLIDSKGQRVLFAEAGKDFADFLFTLLSLPVGTVIRLLSTNGMVGSIGNLYESFENLSSTYIQPNVNKDIILKPSNSALGGAETLLLFLTNDDAASSLAAKKVYVCPFQHNCNQRHVSDKPGAMCPTCNRAISHELPYVAAAAGGGGEGGPGSLGGDEGGFVKGVVTYMIMDDLQVKPMSTISSIAMLNQFHVKEVGSLVEKTVSVGLKEGLNLLKASLQTKTVLTSVFLGTSRRTTSSS
ncbi:hypothetical protein F8388_020491 [Cannabis sativa]|uniref:DUF674 domain-containing protein n=1 Tax=Cannabis sativa TaxID=3483 RepID=A0A7J6EX92_CANSA|nr:hypothetical protein F8388_020491 [Cannabis sativa]